LHREHFLIHSEESVALLLIGCSGSGKSTFAKTLMKLGVGHGYLGTGARFRQHAINHPFYEKIISEYTRDGEHVPLKYTMPLVTEWFQEIVGYRLVLLDGFPRNEEQVDPAFSLLHEHGYRKVGAVYIDRSPETCAHYLALQAAEEGMDRNDTSETAIANRLRKFQEKVVPSLKMVEDRSEVFHRVDANNLNLKDTSIVRDIARKVGIIH
jgi:adenylate kinase family enzyme